MRRQGVGLGMRSVMFARLKIAVLCAVRISTAAILLTALSIQPASSQGMLDTLLGGAIIPPARTLSPGVTENAEPLSLSAPLVALHAPDLKVAREPGGSGAAYCVRLCDGRYFPLARNAALSPAEACRAFCPAVRTKIFFGSNINHATAADGSRYASLDTAMLFRTRLVNDCTCNGRDAFGVARVNIASDPTLRSGDIVAVNGGFAAYIGTRLAARPGTEFTPIWQYSNVPNEVRRRLSETKVYPVRQAEQIPARPFVESKSARRDDRRAQLSR